MKKGAKTMSIDINKTLEDLNWLKEEYDPESSWAYALIHNTAANAIEVINLLLNDSNEH